MRLPTWASDVQYVTNLTTTSMIYDDHKSSMFVHLIWYIITDQLRKMTNDDNVWTLQQSQGQQPDANWGAPRALSNACRNESIQARTSASCQKSPLRNRDARVVVCPQKSVGCWRASLPKATCFKDAFVDPFLDDGSKPFSLPCHNKCFRHLLY